MKLTYTSRPLLSLALLAALGAATSVPAHATVVISSTVGNGSFETPSYPIGTIATDPAGATWAFTGLSGIIVPPSAAGAPGGSAPPAGGPAAPDGSQYAYIQSQGPGTGSNTGSSFTQAVTLTANTTYAFSFQDAGRFDSIPNPTGNTNDLFSVTGGSGPAFQDFFSTTTNQPFGTISGFFSTTTAGTYTVGFANLGTALNTDGTALIDNVNIVSATPEPAEFATLAVFGLSLGGLLLRARKNPQARA